MPQKVGADRMVSMPLQAKLWLRRIQRSSQKLLQNHHRDHKTLFLQYKRRSFRAVPRRVVRRSGQGLLRCMDRTLRASKTVVPTGSPTVILYLKKVMAGCLPVIGISVMLPKTRSAMVATFETRNEWLTT